MTPLLRRLAVVLSAALLATSTTVQSPGSARHDVSDPTDEVPAGLSATDWSSIRAAYGANRQPAHAVAGQSSFP